VPLVVLEAVRGLLAVAATHHKTIKRPCGGLPLLSLTPGQSTVTTFDRMDCKTKLLNFDTINAPYCLE